MHQRTPSPPSPPSSLSSWGTGRTVASSPPSSWTSPSTLVSASPPAKAFGSPPYYAPLSPPLPRGSSVSSRVPPLSLPDTPATPTRPPALLAGCGQGHVTSTSLNPMLYWDQNPRIKFNVLEPIANIRSRDRGLLLWSTPAFSPPLPWVRLKFPDYQGWFFDVSNPSGVTIGDILGSLNNFFCSAMETGELRSLGHPLEGWTLDRHRRQLDRKHLLKGDVLFEKVWFYGMAISADRYSWDIYLGGAPPVVGAFPRPPSQSLLWA